MNISSRFRQNTFQLALLLLGSIASMLISIWVTLMAYSIGNAQTFHMLVNPIIQLLNFIGFHFLFSLIYRSIPWTKVSWIILLLETILIIIPSISEFYLIKMYHSSYNYYYGLVILATNHLELAEYIISTFLSQIIVLAVLFSVLATFATIVAKRLSHKVEQTRFFQKISEPSCFFIIAVR